MPHAIDWVPGTAVGDLWASYPRIWYQNNLVRKVSLAIWQLRKPRLREWNHSSEGAWWGSTPSYSMSPCLIPKPLRTSSPWLKPSGLDSCFPTPCHTCVYVFFLCWVVTEHLEMDAITGLEIHRQKHLLIAQWTLLNVMWQPRREGSLGETGYLHMRLSPFTTHLKLSQHC